jgi:DNA helicase-2/ATP-dependent DNA helicase PcrA
MEYLRGMSVVLPLDQFYDTLIESSGLVRALEIKQTDENLTRIENIKEFRTNVMNFVYENQGGTLADFLGEIALYTDLDRVDTSADCVAMMTMHAAKGLEFDTVFIVGAEDGIFPGMRVIGEPEEMEEERRLCYVAMTRAKRRRFFIKARRRMQFGRTEAHEVSRFIREIGENNIDMPEENPFSEQASRESYWFDDSAGTRGFAKEREYSTRDFTHPQTAKTPARRGEKRSQGSKSKHAAPVAPAAPIVTFKAGDVVEHRAFGRGTVRSITPTGGDALLEVEFERAGSKRLMAKSAASYMNKVE